MIEQHCYKEITCLNKYEVSVEFAQFMLSEKKKNFPACPLCGGEPRLAVNKDTGQFMACCLEPDCRDKIRTQDYDTFADMEKAWRRICEAYKK